MNKLEIKKSRKYKHTHTHTYFFFLSNLSLTSCSSSVSSPPLELEEGDDDDDDASSSSCNLLTTGEGFAACTEVGQSKSESSVTSKSKDDTCKIFILKPCLRVYERETIDMGHARHAGSHLKTSSWRYDASYMIIL